MHRVSSRPAGSSPAGFVLTATLISTAGMLSALIDGTLGWENLALELLNRLAH
jgi:hypothetical protein